MCALQLVVFNVKTDLKINSIIHIQPISAILFVLLIVILIFLISGYKFKHFSVFILISVAWRSRFALRYDYLWLRSAEKTLQTVLEDSLIRLIHTFRFNEELRARTIKLKNFITTAKLFLLLLP